MSSDPSTRDSSPETDKRPEDPATGQPTQPLGQVRDYVLLEQLGQGGMGTVYKASHTMLEREVAVKLLPPERMNDEESVSRFRREMKAVGKLKHPNIVQALDAGEEGGIHYLVMEYADGMDLSNVRKRVGQLSIADACEVIRQAAVGLQHAHEFGMVHRDIKPSNLLLTHDGQVKVLDLGLALLQGDPNFGRELTTTGQIMGTIDYIAPEQVDDTHTVDIRADIYSLGCTLYSLLAGEPPFGGPQYSSPLKKMRAHDQTPPPPIQQKRKEVPDVIASILDRMLAKAPDDRYQAPDEIANALEPFCDRCDLPGLLKKAQAFDVQTLQNENSSERRTEQNASSGLTATRPVERTIGEPTQDVPQDEEGRTGHSIEPTIDMSDPRSAGENIPAVAEVAKTSEDFIPNQPERVSVRFRVKPWANAQRLMMAGKFSTAARVIVGILLIPLFIAAIFFGPQIIRVMTGKGQLIIETNDKDIEVTVRKDGAEIIDRQTKRRYDLKLGDYEIEVRELPEGIKLLTKKFTITRGDKEILNVEAELAKTKPLKTQPSTVDLSEPLPLAQWLQGRKIITVKQDGTADHTTIQAALNALEPGQVVKVLDRGPYRERITRSPPKNTGLISEVGTIVEIDQWQESDKNRVGHTLYRAQDFRLHGLRFSFESESLGNQYLGVIVGGHVVFENCCFDTRQVRDLDKDELFSLVSVISTDPSKSIGGTMAVIRECVFIHGILGIANANKRPVPQMVVRRNLFLRPFYHAIRTLGLPKNELVIQHNVFHLSDQPQSSSFNLSRRAPNTHPFTLVSNNTVIGDIHENTFTAIASGNETVRFSNNITGNVHYVSRGEPSEGFRNWTSDHNAFVTDQVSSRYLPRSETDLTHKPKYLSVNLAHANYARIPALSPLATAGVGGNMPDYIGALPPGPAPTEGAWFTRLRERWRDVLEESRGSSDTSPEPEK